MISSRQIPLKVLYEDNHLIAVHKPHRIPTQGDSSKDPNLLDIVKEYLKQKYQKPGNVFVGLVHRLDRPVAGVVVFAKTSKAASRLSESIRLRRVVKTYHALVQGSLIGQGELKHYIKSEESGPVEIQDREFSGAKVAELFYRSLSPKKDRTLVEIELRTGRKHQIRAQLAKIGHPILGDTKYGATTPFEKGAIALLAKRFSIKHPVKEEIIDLVSETSL